MTDRPSPSSSPLLPPRCKLTLPRLPPMILGGSAGASPPAVATVVPTRLHSATERGRGQQKKTDAGVCCAECVLKRGGEETKKRKRCE